MLNMPPLTVFLVATRMTVRGGIFPGILEDKKNNCFGYLNIKYSVHSKGKAKVMTETMETTVFHSLHSSHLEILTVNMDILLVVMLQFKPHIICILKLLPNNVLTPHKQENRPVQPAYILFVATYILTYTIVHFGTWIARPFPVYIWQCPTSFHTHHHQSYKY